jgi:hypothetical protein
MAAAITKTGKGGLGSQFGPGASTDLVFDIVNAVADGTTVTINTRAHATPQVDNVKTPLAVMPVATNTGGTAGLYWTYASGTITITGATAIASTDTFTVFIVGTAS